MKIPMPSFGQTTADMLVAKWHKRLGDAVRRGDVLMEVETDKSVLPVESFTDGVLTQCLCAEGDTVQTGDTIAVVERETASLQEDPDRPSAPPPSSVEEPPMPPSPAACPPSANPPQAAQSARRAASPKARRLARESGLDVNTLGVPGRPVLAADIQAADAKRPALTPEGPIPAPLPPKAPGTVFSLSAEVCMREALALAERTAKRRNAPYAAADFVRQCVAWSSARHTAVSPVSLIDMGQFGVTAVTPIPDGPCALGLGAPRGEDALMTVTAVFNGQRVSYEEAAAFLADIKRYLDQPALPLLGIFDA